MTEQEQQISISKACGWEWHHTQSGGCYVSPDKQDTVRRWKDLPDYLNDLNAMHDAEKVMSDDQREQFAYELLGLLGIDCDEPCTPLEIARAISATAAQRAEAFLRCLGKWKD